MAARRIRPEYVVLGVVIVGLALAVALRSGNRVRYKLPSLPEVASDDITRLTIARASGTVELEKREGLWRIEPEGYAADGTLVTPMLNALADLELSALVSEAGSYPRYELDEASRLRVTARAGTEVARVLDVGKEAESGKASFVKLEGDRNVYSSRQNLRSLFEKDKPALRDMTVMSFAESTISEITAKAGGESLTLKRVSVENADKTSTTSWKSAQGEEWDQERVRRLLGTLSRLRCESYGESGAGMGEEILSVFLKAEDGTGYTLAVHEKVGSTYPALSSQSDYPFTLAEYKYRDIAEVLEKPEETPD